MQPPRPARRLTPLLALALALAGAAPAHSEAAVLVSATRNGALVEITGTAALPDGPFQSVAPDSMGDVGTPLGNQLAGDLTDVSLSTRADGGLAVRWSLASLPSSPNGTAGIARFRFRAGGADYEVAAARSDASGFDGCTSNNVPCRGGWLLRCGSAGCSWTPQGANGGPTLISRDIEVTTDSTGKLIQAVAPPATLTGVLTPGAVMADYTGSPGTEASTALGQLESSMEVDAAEMIDYYIFGLRVWLTAAAPGADPPSLDYATAATVAADNVHFSGSLPVPAGQAVFAKACLGGPTNCAYGRSPAI